MNDRIENLPAFPRIDGLNQGGVLTDVIVTGGISMRDYFAAKAPPMPEQWWEDTPKFKEDGNYVHIAEAIAAWNYFYANAMLAERAKNER